MKKLKPFIRTGRPPSNPEGIKQPEYAWAASSMKRIREQTPVLRDLYAFLERPLP